MWDSGGWVIPTSQGYEFRFIDGMSDTRGDVDVRISRIGEASGDSKKCESSSRKILESASHPPLRL